LRGRRGGWKGGKEEGAWGRMGERENGLRGWVEGLGGVMVRGGGFGINDMEAGRSEGAMSSSTRLGGGGGADVVRV